MKAEHTMTPAEEAEWVRMMRHEPQWRDIQLTALQDVIYIAQREAARLAGLIAFLAWFGL